MTSVVSVAVLLAVRPAVGSGDAAPQPVRSSHAEPVPHASRTLDITPSFDLLADVAYAGQNLWLLQGAELWRYGSKGTGEVVRLPDAGMKVFPRGKTADVLLRNGSVVRLAGSSLAPVTSLSAGGAGRASIPIRTGYVSLVEGRPGKHVFPRGGTADVVIERDVMRLAGSDFTVRHRLSPSSPVAFPFRGGYVTLDEGSLVLNEGGEETRALQFTDEADTSGAAHGAFDPTAVSFHSLDSESFVFVEDDPYRLMSRE